MAEPPSWGEELLPSIRGAPRAAQWKARSSEEQDVLDAKGRLVQLKRELQKKSAQRSRVDFHERQHAAAQEVRRVMDVRTGRDIAAGLNDVRPSSPWRVADMAEKLNDVLIRDYNVDMRTKHEVEVTTPTPAQEHAVWMRLWREVNDEGRMAFTEFEAIMRNKLNLRGRTKAERAQRDKIMQSVWRAIGLGRFDPDAFFEEPDEAKSFAQVGGSSDEAKPYLVLTEFIEFMKSGSYQRKQEREDADGSASMADSPPDWRTRVAEQKRLAAASVRESRPNRLRIDADGERIMDGMQFSAWRMQMEYVLPASDAEVRQLSYAINGRLGKDSWVTVVKEHSPGGGGQLTYDDVVSIITERLGVEGTPEYHVLRRIWKALDPECWGHVSIPRFGNFMHLGSAAAAHEKVLSSFEAQSANARAVAEEEGRQKRQAANSRMSDLKARFTNEAEQLQRALEKLKREEGSRSTAAPAQTDRSHHVKTLSSSHMRKIYEDRDDKNAYLGHWETREHKRRMAQNRRISERLRAGP